MADGLERLAGALRGIGDDGSEAPRPAAPVHLWNPSHCGELDIRITRDGTWFYLGTPIGRPALVRLLSSVLKREAGSYFLVTPVEKVGIQVEDAPFLAVEMAVRAAPTGRALDFRTNVGEWIACGDSHPLRFVPGAHDGLVPYLHVRHDQPDALWAKVTRSVYYDLVACGEVRDVDGMAMFGVASRGAFFAACPARDIEAGRVT